MAKTGSKKDLARKMAIEAARIAEADNCQDIVVLDLRGISPITDYFVICTGASNRQMRTVADDVVEAGLKSGNKAYQIAGIDSPDWIVADFVDVVVHIFNESRRKYYDLELIWGEAPRVRWKRPVRRKTTEQ